MEGGSLQGSDSIRPKSGMTLQNAKYASGLKTAESQWSAKRGKIVSRRIVWSPDQLVQLSSIKFDLWILHSCFHATPGNR